MKVVFSMIRSARIALVLLVFASSLMAGYGEEADLSAQEIAQKMEESFKSQYLKTRGGDQPVYHFSFYLRCANSLMQKGEYEAAKVELEKVRRYFPMDYWAHSLYCSGLARLAKHTNEYAKAIEARKEFMKRYEKDCSPACNEGETVCFNSCQCSLYAIAELYEEWGKYEQALEYWDRLIEFVNQPESELGHGHCVKNRDLRDYWVNVEYPARKATVYYKMGKFSEAINLAEKIRQWAPQTDAAPDLTLEQRQYIKYFVEVLVTKQLADSYLEYGLQDIAMMYYGEIVERRDAASRYGTHFASEYEKLAKKEIHTLIEKYNKQLSSASKH